MEPVSHPVVTRFRDIPNEDSNTNTNMNTLMRNDLVCKELRIHAFYTDFAAGVQAKLLADGMCLVSGIAGKSALEIWKLDSIPPNGPLKQMIVNEARSADVWIIACSKPNEWAALIVQWISDLHRRRDSRFAPPLLAGLFGVGAGESFEYLIELLTSLAERTGQNFIWRPMDRVPLNHAEWIKEPIVNLAQRKMTGSAAEIEYRRKDEGLLQLRSAP